jgi:hypothetical protein
MIASKTGTLLWSTLRVSSQPNWQISDQPEETLSGKPANFFVAASVMKKKSFISLVPGCLARCQVRLRHLRLGQPLLGVNPFILLFVHF